eukprot:CAMPEP_0197078672 /NCGR_PEP_ID=MMETSP1384-20130603/213239_1 /TAXON_ID=29189 /ORGANISM="Ammonia sp." /LENGTH=363 /DNA_ID=CAMNT_0042517539 /DNA_START=1 /DNA_END=1093 /DNA_ORIENTATION=+
MAATRRRKKSKSRQSNLPSQPLGKGHNRKSKTFVHVTSDSDDSDSGARTDDFAKKRKSRRGNIFASNKNTQLLLCCLCSILVIILLCISGIWMEYSRRTDMEFQLQKLKHEAEMKRIALDRAKIDAELEKLQKNLKELEYNKELVQIQQSHEMEMESLKLKHKKEVEKLKIENERESEDFSLKMHKMKSMMAESDKKLQFDNERESEDFSLKMQKMKSMMAESDKKLQFERDKNEMELRHQTERLKLEHELKLEEEKTKDGNQRQLSELKITKSSELYNNALDALRRQVATEKEALELKRTQCIDAKSKTRDSWWPSSKQQEFADDVCADYKEYKDDVNKLVDKLTSMSQRETPKLTDNSTSE